MKKSLKVIVSSLLAFSLIFGATLSFSDAASTSTTKTIEKLKKQVKDLTSSNKKKDAEIKKLKAQVRDKDKEINNLKSSVKSKDKEISGLKSSVISKDKQISNLKSSITDKDKEISALKSEVSSLKEQLNPPATKPKDLITKSDLPYTHCASNGMSLTINSYEASFGGIKMNMTIKNNSTVSDKGELMTSTWEIYDGKNTLDFLEQDRLFWDTNYLRAGQEVTGNVVFKGLSNATNTFSLYGKLWQYIDAEEFKLTFEVE